jgi:hypothetical protein
MKNSYYDYTKHEGRVFTEPSLTVPDQAMTVREILERYASGMPLDGQPGEPWYDEESNGVNLKTLDLSERAELLNNYREMRDEAKKAQEREKLGAFEQMREDYEALKKQVEKQKADEEAAKQ